METGCLRIRKKGSKYILGVKQRVDRSSRMERMEAENHSLTESQYNYFKEKAGDFSLVKTRYLIPYSEWTIELDIYGGKLTGHKTAEVEFKSKSEGLSFKPPEWFGRDVTEDERYSNKTLAKEQKFPD